MPSNKPEDNQTVDKIRINSVLTKLKMLKPLLEMRGLEKEMFHNWLTFGDGRVYQEIIEEFSSELGFILEEENIKKIYESSLFIALIGLTTSLFELLEKEPALLDFLHEELCVNMSNLEIVQNAYLDFQKNTHNFLKDEINISEFPAQENDEPTTEQQTILDVANAECKKNQNIKTANNKFITSSTKVYLQMKAKPVITTTVDEYTDKAKIVLKNNIYTLRPGEILDIDTPLPSLLEDIGDLLEEVHDFSLTKCRIM